MKTRYSGDNRFIQENYCNPSNKYSPVFSWMWNTRISREATEKQLKKYASLGVRNLYVLPESKKFRPVNTPSELSPDYLTDEYLDECEFLVEKAKEYGIGVWIYDESGWPSGSANGMVTDLFPELSKKYLKNRFVEYRAGEKLSLDPCDVVAFTSERSVIENGYCFEKDTNVEICFSVESFEDRKKRINVPDLTYASATDCFINETHEKYKSRFSSEFGKSIFAVFTDEPACVHFPFNETIAAEFEKKHGFSIVPYLTYLLNEGEYSEEINKIKITWFNFLSDTFCENYFMKCKNWCNENNLLFLGHIDKDDSIDGGVGGRNYGALKALRTFDVPGVDVITRQIFPSNSYEPDYTYGGCSSMFFPRLASSAAVQTGKNNALAEIFAVYGNGLTFEQMRYIVGFLAVRGINVFNPFLLNYSEGELMKPQERPCFDENYACYSHLGEFVRYCERLSYLNSIGEYCNDVALYIPQNDLFLRNELPLIKELYETTGRKLERIKTAFDLIDDEVLSKADDSEIKNGVLSFGNAEYKSVVIPVGEYLSDEAARSLSAFALSGGNVYCGEKCRRIEGAKPIEFAFTELKPKFNFESDSEKIILGIRKTEDGKAVYLFNQSEEKSKIKITDSEYKYNYVFDLNNGDILSDEYFVLQGGDTVCVLCQNEQIDSNKRLNFENNIQLEDFEMKKNTSTTFRELSKQRITADFTEHKCDYKPCCLGDWQQINGKEYSGSACYKTKFRSLEKAEKYLLDLGKVNYTCEASLNGHFLGIRIAPPYSYLIPNDLINDENELVITVYNTMANQFVYSDVFETFDEKIAYHPTSIEFEKESLESGLYGPVKLFFE